MTKTPGDLAFALSRVRWWLQYRNDKTLSPTDRQTARQRIKVWIAESKRIKKSLESPR